MNSATDTNTARLSILVTDRITNKALIHLQSCPEFQVQCVQDFKSVDLNKVAGIFTRSKTKIEKRILEQMPNLKAIATATSGFDHIDLVTTSNLGIKVGHVPEANAASAAELTWALVLACARNLKKAESQTRAGKWSKDLDLGIQLEGKTYGIVGLGRIGKRVAKISQAFGMRLVAYDPYLEDKDFADANAQRCSLEECLRASDVVSLHVPLTRETKRMINSNTFECLHERSILVNTSRGGIVDEDSLLQVLRDKEIGAVGLDVFECEPMDQNHSLLQYPQLLVSPHIGARTEEAYEAASETAARELVKVLRGSDFTHSLPPKTEWYSNPSKMI